MNTQDQKAVGQLLSHSILMSTSCILLPHMHAIYYDM